MYSWHVVTLTDPPGPSIRWRSFSSIASEPIVVWWTAVCSSLFFVSVQTVLPFGVFIGRKGDFPPQSPVQLSKAKASIQQKFIHFLDTMDLQSFLPARDLCCHGMQAMLPPSHRRRLIVREVHRSQTTALTQVPRLSGWDNSC